MATDFGFGDLFGEDPFASSFPAPEGALQDVPVSILTPDPPDLAYLWHLFNNPSSTQSSQQLETTLNSSFPPYYNFAPSSLSPQIVSPVSDVARPFTIYPAPVIFSPPTPSPSQNSTGCPYNWRKIPQTVYGLGKKRWDYQPSEPILFHVDGRPGVNMGAALRNEFTGLHGRDDPMFQDTVDAFLCRLMFPGYPLNSKPQIFTRRWNKGRDPIARSTLVHHIARKLEYYLDSMAATCIIDGSTDKHWEIKRGFMTLDNMFLVRLEHVSTGSYQPEIYVVDHTM